jgi:hypothetical protein
MSLAMQCTEKSELVVLKDGERGSEVEDEERESEVEGRRSLMLG